MVEHVRVERASETEEEREEHHRRGGDEERAPPVDDGERGDQDRDPEERASSASSARLGSGGRVCSTVSAPRRRRRELERRQELDGGQPECRHGGHRPRLRETRQVRGPPFAPAEQVRDRGEPERVRRVADDLRVTREELHRDDGAEARAPAAAWAVSRRAPRRRRYLGSTQGRRGTAGGTSRSRRGRSA
jgi:hypothetical protein